jgi:hypothetical protein
MIGFAQPIKTAAAPQMFFTRRHDAPVGAVRRRA